MKQDQQNMEEILKKIEKSAEDITVPEELKPEQIKEKLLKQKQQKKHSVRRRWAEAAAAIALVAVIGGSGVYGFLMKNHGAANTAAGPESETELSAGQGAASGGEIAPVVKKEEVGDFQLAKNYEDVYDSVRYVEEDALRDGISGALNGGILNEQEKYAVNYETAEDVAAQSSGEENGVDHSNTNLQVEGVDESDYVKNDGSYLYLQTDNQVSIVDIREKKMKNLAVLKPEMGADDRIVDMYVDGDQVSLIMQKRETTLGKGSREGSKRNEIAEYTEDVLYYMDSNSYLELQTYDITDRTQAKKTGSVTMDGEYQTSRKNGDYIYLFSNKYIGGISKKDKDTLIPEINGAKVEADCIYVQEDASTELIAASVNVKNPREIVDRMVLLNANMQLYMGVDSMILYGENYRYSETAARSSTDLTRFMYKDGHISAVAAGSVKGTIQDPFAISEADGILRILTTEWSGNSTNQLFLLDENLKLLGSLQDIAVGEEIYAARYIGDRAYFITYHNTDPLFAVDISDPENPKMLGQLKVTGYSDYLHPYGKNLLLGIGYETDPDTSERLGVKITMFDTSDAKELKVLDSVTVKGDYCPAAEDYKCALVDSGKNVIGFETSQWSEGIYSAKYYVYGWDGKHFISQFAKKLDSDDSADYYGEARGQYAGSRFYLINRKDSGFGICSYDMEKEYEEIDSLCTK